MSDPCSLYLKIAAVVLSSCIVLWDSEWLVPWGTLQYLHLYHLYPKWRRHPLRLWIQDWHTFAAFLTRIRPNVFEAWRRTCFFCISPGRGTALQESTRKPSDDLGGFWSLVLMCWTCPCLPSTEDDFVIDRRRSCHCEWCSTTCSQTMNELGWARLNCRITKLCQQTSQDFAPDDQETQCYTSSKSRTDTVLFGVSPDTRLLGIRLFCWLHTRSYEYTVYRIPVR